MTQNIVSAAQAVGKVVSFSSVHIRIIWELEKSQCLNPTEQLIHNL